MNKFIELAGKLGAQRHLVAIREGFIALIPLIIVGSFAILIKNFPPLGHFELVQLLNGIFGEGKWQVFADAIWSGTLAILGLLTTFSIAYHLAKSYNINALAVGFISIASYIAFVPETNNQMGLDYSWLGAQGIFIAIILAMVVTELFRILSHTKFVIKLPPGIPIGVEKSFRAIIPAFLILLLVGLLQAIIHRFLNISIFEVVFNIIQEPLQGLGSTLTAAIIVAFLTQVLWFFGLHGTNILGAIIEPIYIPLVIDNAEMFKAGTSAFEVPYIVTKPFLDTFVFMGGSGTTLSLLVAIFIVIRNRRQHTYLEVAKVAAPAGIFNINEPLIFGLPIMLNPVMFIPFILNPVILVIVSYTALRIGLVPKTVALVPWSTPPFLSGFLVTGGSWRGVILQLVNLIIATVVYIPFVIAGMKATHKSTKM